MSKLRTLHIYGQTAIQSLFCPKCMDYAFVVAGKMTCCKTPASQADPDRIKIEVDTSNNKRKLPSIYERNAILEQQANRCLYCGDEFESSRRIDGKVKRVRLHWDHFVPFAYNHNNHEFIAACAECNQAKKCRHFSNLKEAQDFLGLRMHERKTA